MGKQEAQDHTTKAAEQDDKGRTAAQAGHPEVAEQHYASAGLLYCMAGDEYMGLAPADTVTARSCYDHSADEWEKKANLNLGPTEVPERERALQKQINSLLKKADTYTKTDQEYWQTGIKAVQIITDFAKANPTHNSKLDLQPRAC